MTDKLEYYINKFSKLHPDKNRHTWTKSTSNCAPHKMLLLLSVIELIELGLCETDFIEISPELLDTFDRYWSSIMPLGTRGNIVLPFFHMRREGFWALRPNPGKEVSAAELKRCDSFRQLNEVFSGASLDQDLFLLLQNMESRKRLRSTIIHTYFSTDFQERLFYTIRNNKASFEYGQEILDFAKERSVAESIAEFSVKEPEEKVRDQGFRKAVVTIYEHRCATCGIRMLTPQGHTVVDASHIIPWSESNNDDIRNGLCLCKLCHWAFDELLITITHRHRIKVSPSININSNIPGNISQIAGREIIKPSDEAFYPGDEFLEHHRSRFLKAI